MSKPIIAVAATVIKNKKIYVSGLGAREDSKKLVYTTSDPAEAHDFGTKEEAWESIKSFHNPLDRDYQPESLIADKPIKTRSADLV